MSLENTLGLDKKLVIKFKQLFMLLNMSFTLPLKIICPVRNQGKFYFGCMEMDKTKSHYESYGRTYKKH